MQVKKIPLPFCGVALGLAALGNLVGANGFGQIIPAFKALNVYGPILKNIFGIISAIILVLLLIKILSDVKGFAEEMKNPITASVFGTYSMALMILSGYIPNSLIWWIGFIMHIIIMIYFTITFVFKFNIKQVFTSWYIVYVGIVAMNINCKQFGQQALGEIVFYFGFVCTLILLCLVMYRIYVVKEIPDPAKPLFCINTAPVSLCLAGYMTTFADKNSGLIYFMLVLSLLIYLLVLINLPGLLKMPFFPSYAAFTFPMVISAIACKLTTAQYLGGEVKANPGLANITKNIFQIQTWIALILVLYALIRFVQFICKNEK